MAAIYYKEAVGKLFYSGALLVYDITNEKSFDKVSKMNQITKWAKELKENAEPNIVIAIIANKCDLERERVVPKDAGETKAQEIGGKHFSASAKNSTGIDEVFTYMAKGKDRLK